MYRKKLVIVILLLNLFSTVACQSKLATPTLQLGETAMPFETLFLDEFGQNLQLTPEQEVAILNSPTDVIKLQSLISPEAFQKLKQVNFDVRSVVALFHVDVGGCSGFGVTIERLVRTSDTLIVYANLWQPPSGGACAEEGLFSPYHLVLVSKEAMTSAISKWQVQSQKVERHN
ncbi:MAG: hypothetical protein U0175_34795 [Caldilineaceae bacterium]